MNIDKEMVQNHISYGKLAEEYYSPRHITSRNFDQATLNFLKKNPFQIDDLILELGCGKGRTTEYLECESDQVILSDISKEMLELNSSSALLKIVCDARKTPFLDEAFNYISAFLYDPFNTPQLYNELNRVLKKGGKFIGTLPHKKWGMTLRDHLNIPRNKTKFITNNDEELLLDSFLMDDTEIQNIAKNNNFEIVIQEDLKLSKNTNHVSPHINIPSKILDIHFSKIPIVKLIILKKL